MSLKSKNLLSICLFTLFTFYQPSPNGSGQTRDTIVPITETVTIPLPPPELPNEAVEYIDTLKTTYKKFAKQVDKAEENANIAKKQVEKSAKQSQVISKQTRIIDSLQRIKDARNTIKTKNSSRVEIIEGADTIIFIEHPKKGIKNWGIWNIFKKNHK